MHLAPFNSLLTMSLIFHSVTVLACPVNNDDMKWNHFQESSTITDIDFDRLVERVSESYSGKFKERGLKLNIEANWKSNKMNAFSDQSGAKRFIYLYGGYARHPLMTKDTYLSVICHEVGHHLGGLPLKTNSTWASAEGQADYYSTLKCMKEVLKGDLENENVALSLDLPNEVKDECRTQHIEDDDYYICLRSSKAAEIYGKINASLATPNESTLISLLTPVTRRVVSTNLDYPSPQCRVDTKYQGALCNTPIEISIGYSDENKGACSIKNGNSMGARPGCWFSRKLK